MTGRIEDPQAENTHYQAATSKQSEVAEAAQIAATGVLKYAPGTAASAGSVSSWGKAKRKPLRLNSTLSAESSEPPRTPPDSINFDPTVTTGTTSSDQGSSYRAHIGRYARPVGSAPPVPRVPIEVARKTGIEQLLQNVLPGSRKPSTRGLRNTAISGDSDNHPPDVPNQKPEGTPPLTLEHGVIGSPLTPIPDTPAERQAASASYESLQEQAMRRIGADNLSSEPSDGGAGTSYYVGFSEPEILPPASTVRLDHMAEPFLLGTVDVPAEKYAEQPSDREFNFRALEEEAGSDRV
ncbi:unnamed protein product [Cyclocybe aegerita]|uniref:Uncharacterized protein n=1 Tax=Cyclocybe aegerita TaxID=1973307 RepID=A0A8S0X7H8_CYCAE|nr:unnamed protein product [Cyclocybe aegerita]